MTWLAIVILLLFALAWVLLRPPNLDPEPEPEELPDASDEEMMRAATELHDISRRLDVAWTRHELRTESSHLRRELAEELRAVEALEAEQDEE